jgi:hypothetical protein
VKRDVTDRVSDLLLCTSADAVENLTAEGVTEDVQLVGNTMLDSLFRSLEGTDREAALAAQEVEPGAYVLITLHRPALVDDEQRLGDVIEVLGELAAEMPVLFPAHPRTVARLEDAGIAVPEGMRMAEPMDYSDFIALEGGARLVITDSGGVQEETSALGVRCLTYRDSTERPVTVERGTVAAPEGAEILLRAVLPAHRPRVAGPYSAPPDHDAVVVDGSGFALPAAERAEIGHHPILPDKGVRADRSRDVAAADDHPSGVDRVGVRERAAQRPEVADDIGDDGCGGAGRLGRGPGGGTIGTAGPGGCHEEQRPEGKKAGRGVGHGFLRYGAVPRPWRRTRAEAARASCVEATRGGSRRFQVGLQPQLPDRLRSDFSAEAPAQRWVAAITAELPHSESELIIDVGAETIPSAHVTRISIGV